MAAVNAIIPLINRVLSGILWLDSRSDTRKSLDEVRSD